MSSKISVFSVGVIIFALASNAGALFRYKDESGQTVMSASVPPEIVPKGYEVLSSSGRVLEVIPPALTPEQIKARDEAIEQGKLEEERKRLEAEKRAQQLVEDKRLLKQYGEPDVVVSLMERRISEIDAVIKSRKASIESAKKLIIENEEQAAELQRNGKPIYKRIKDALEKSRDNIATSQSIILEREHAKTKLIAEFTKTIQRLEMLTGKSVSKSDEEE